MSSIMFESKTLRRVTTGLTTLVAFMAVTGIGAAHANNWLYSEYQREVVFRHDNRNVHEARLVRDNMGSASARKRWTLRFEFSSKSHVAHVTQVAFSNDRTGRSGGWVAYDKEVGICRTVACYSQVRGGNRIKARISFAPLSQALQPGNYKFAVFRLRLVNGNISYFFLPMDRYKQSVLRMSAAVDPAASSPAVGARTAVPAKPQPLEQNLGTRQSSKALQYQAATEPYTTAKILQGMMNSCWMKSRARRNNWFGMAIFGNISTTARTHEIGVIDASSLVKSLIMKVEPRGSGARIIVSGYAMDTDVGKELRRDLASWTNGGKDCPPM